MPLAWWALGAALAGAVFWTFVLATPPVFALGLSVATFGCIALALWTWGSAPLVVADSCLRAGRAVLPLQHCRAVTSLDAEETRAQRGPQADARAYLLLRPYISTAVRVDLDDPSDPAPYWLLSTRRPHQLAAAVRASAVAAPGAWPSPEVTD